MLPATTKWIIKKPSLLIVLLAFFVSAAMTEAQNVTWEAVYGGVYNETGTAGCRSLDGTYAVLGSTFSFGAGDYDLYLLKVNTFGDTLWSRTYGGSLADYGYDIIATADNGFILVGSSQSFGSGKSDMYLIRVDSLGKTVWQKTYGGSGNDEGRSIQRTADNNYIIVGTTSSFGAGYDDVYLLKIDNNGALLWQRTYGGAGGETGRSVSETSDSGFIIVGSTGSFATGYSSIYVIRTGMLGDSLWAGAYGGNKADFGADVVVTADKGYAIIGSTTSFGMGYADLYVLKLDSGGFFQWQTTLGGTSDDRGFSIDQTANLSYLIGGTTDSYGGGQTDILVAQLDSNGTQIWERTFGGSKSDYCKSILLEDFACVMIGYSYSFTTGGSDLYLMKIATDQTTGIDDDGQLSNSPSFMLYDAYPNPFNLETVISFELPRRTAVSITIHNILGQTVRQYSFDSAPSGLFSLTWDGRSNQGDVVASGVYFYRMSAGNKSQTKKVLLLK